MKLQCDLCREIVVADFAIRGDAIEVRCPACEKSFQVAARRTTDVAIAPRRAGEAAMTCPKCGDGQPEAVACRTCGLLRDRWSDFVRDRDARVDPVVDAAWREVEAHWDDDALHDRFVEAVAAQLAFPVAAQRYREALRLRPDDARAAAQLARVARMAEATLLSSAVRKAPAAPHPYRNTVMVMAAALVLIVVGFVLAMLMERTAPDAPPAAPPRPPAQPRH